MITHLAALAAANPAHVSNLKYATETWTPGGTALAVIILAVLILAWVKVPSGRRVTGRREPAPAKAQPGRRARQSAKAPAR